MGRRPIDDRMRSPVMRTIDKRRQEIGWSQAQLALACFTTQSHISSLLRGTSEPTLAVLERMCRALGLELVAVYTGEFKHGR